MTSHCVNISDGGDSRATSSASMAEYPPRTPRGAGAGAREAGAVEAKVVSSAAREAELRVRVGQLDLAPPDRFPSNLRGQIGLFCGQGSRTARARRTAGFGPTGLFSFQVTRT